MKEYEEIVLASSSPRRIELLHMTGLHFRVQPSDVDERLIPHKTPRELALKAAYQKALDVAKHYRSALVIGADTIVCLENEIFGKPMDKKDARRMLEALSGKTHRVITGIAVKESAGATASLDAVETRVTMARLSGRDIDGYIASGEPMDKAGAYAIQGRAGKFVTSIEGCYFNVVGLPLERLVLMLREYLPHMNLTIPEPSRSGTLQR